MGFQFNKELFKELVKKNGLTQQKITEELNKRELSITLDGVKAWTKKGLSVIPTYEKVFALGEILKVDPMVLITNNITDKKHVKKVLIVGATSCGAVIANDYQAVNDYTYYNGKHWTPDLYCVIACGDSMSPEIEDGDEIICDPKAEVQSGDMVHYRIGDESAVKVYVRDDEAYIVQLIPYNSDDTFKTKTIRLDDEEANNVKISKVVAVNKLKFNNRKARLKLVGRA